MRRFSAVVIVLLLLCRCATVTRRPTELLSISSNPVGAGVVVDCGVLDSPPPTKTPAQVRVYRRTSPCSFTFSMPGYQTRTVSLERPIGRRYFANALSLALCGTAAGGDDEGWDLGPLILCATGIAVSAGGFVLDLGTGSAWQHQPNNIDVTLEQAPQPAQ